MRESRHTTRLVAVLAVMLAVLAVTAATLAVLAVPRAESRTTLFVRDGQPVAVVVNGGQS